MGTLSDSPAARNLMIAEWAGLHAAIMFAEAKHRGQVDKGGEPYIYHPLRVGISLLPDVEAAMLGILHDVVEDTDASLDEVAALMGFDSELRADLEALTHRKEEETYNEYLARVEARPRAKKVKIADLKDNMDPRRQAGMALRHGAQLVASKKLTYELALSRLGESNVLTFARILNEPA